MMVKQNLDLVIGSRFLEGKRPRTLRNIGNELLDKVILMTTGQRITDATSGMRLYGNRVLKALAADQHLKEKQKENGARHDESGT